ncbi:hypothetical protein [Sphingobacterium sp. LRF_L2]|uniref:hypothetical protein n=1 Tax=Sphingobacterium sp. LRF_L2 TaxID=3369421 RepID=UPI003F61EE42
MAIQKDGANGNIVGKFGAAYAYMLNGQNIIRGKRRPNRREPTPGQLLNQEKMKVASAFIRQLNPMVTYGYKDIAPKGNVVGPFQTAQRHVFTECLELSEDNKPYVNPEKFLVFRGELVAPQDCTVDREGTTLHLSWNATSISSLSLIHLNVFVSNFDGLAELKTAIAPAYQGSIVLELPILRDENKIHHVYVGFVDTYKNLLSDSVYVGGV